MKTIKYIDVIVQLILILPGLTFLVMTFAISDAYLLLVFYAQFFLGVWQFSGSLLTSFAGTQNVRARRIHLGLSLCYLLGFYVGASAFWASPILLHAIPWLLGLFYFSITVRDLPNAKVTGKGFLPHLSF